MDKDRAHRIGGAWGELVANRWPFEGDPTPENYRRVRSAVRYHLATFVPDAEHAVALNAPDAPIILALADDALYAVRMAKLDAEAPQVECRRLPVHPARAGAIGVTAELKRGEWGVYRNMTWRFDLGGDEIVEVNTGPGIAGEPHEEELFVRALAERLGWQLLPEAALSAAA